VPGSGGPGQLFLEVPVQQYVIFPALALLIVWMLVRRFTKVIGHMAKSPELRTILMSVTALLAGGTYVFHQVEHWRFLDALYFCVISLTTVGYGDLSPQTDAGKVMAMVYIVLGLGIVMAFVTTVAQVSIEQARARQELGRGTANR
jgi:voltage-gated potassium channel